MTKINEQQMRTMKYGTWTIGNHIAIKQRFTAEMIHMIMMNPDMMQHSDSITIIMNRQGTHGHLAGVFHQDTHFAQTFAKAKLRAKAKLMIGKGLNILNTIECESLLGEARPVMVPMNHDVDDELPF